MTMECPFCRLAVKNLQLHFSRKVECGEKVDMNHFSNRFETYRKEMNKIRDREKKKKQKEKDPITFKLNRNERAMKAKQKQKEADPESFNQSNNEAAKKSQKKRRDISPESFIRSNRKALKKSRMKSSAAVDDRKRILNFKKATLFGPIFICSCCKRQLFENGVTKITTKFTTKLHKNHPGFYRKVIKNEEIVEVRVNGSDRKTGNYICSTCKTAIIGGKVPSMAEINGLELVNIEDDCHLTELENNLIALNLNFQYIFCLKKSRWGATKNQMISVPVGPNTVINTVQQLPRLPTEAGLIPVQLKRKKEYQRCHKKELIDPEKIIRAINLLIRSGHPYYHFFADITSYEQRCKEQDERGHQLLFGIDDLEEDGRGGDTENMEIDEESQKYGTTKDTIRKSQFDHNRNTAMTHNYPEADVDENGRRQSYQEELSFAPAEGNYHLSI
jgi:hypothetical protein